MISRVRKWFGGSDPEDDHAGLADLRLDSMGPGDLVDYDLKTWEVTGRSVYDYDGFPAREWQLTCGEEVRFLERSEEDGRVGWTLTRSIAIGDIDEDVTAAIAADEDPPGTLHFEGRRYAASESTAGVQWDLAGDGSKDEGSAREFVNWSYEAEDGRVLFVVQWGEQRFSAYEGENVEEYSFTDILPGGER